MMRPTTGFSRKIYRRLVCALNAVQQKQNSHQQRHQRHPAQRQRKQRDERGSGKIQHDHDVAFVHSVCNDTAHGRKHHHGQKAAGGNKPQQRGRTGLIKQIQRQCKTQHRVAEQRDDLADDDENEVLTEAFCFLHGYFLSVMWCGGASRRLLIPTVGMYISKNKLPFRTGYF